MDRVADYSNLLCDFLSHLSLGVNDDNIRISRKHKVCNFTFAGKGFTRTGYTQDKRIAVQKTFAVGNYHIVANSILPVIDAVFMSDLLNLERHKHRQAFGSQRSCCLYLFTADRQYGIKPVGLLKFQNGKLAQMPSCRRKYGFCIRIKLFFAVRHVRHCNGGTHHSLIAGGKVIQKFLAFFTLKLHIIRNNRRKIVVLILLSLPVG